jgi:predicted membrane protein
MTGEVRRGTRLTPQALLGLLVIVFGLLLTGDNLGWFDADEVLRYWPLGLMAVGLLKIVQGQGRSGRVAGAVLTAVGFMFVAETLLNWPIDFDDWWPLLLVALGILVLTRSFDRGRRAGVPSSADANVSEFAFWSGKVRRTTSAAFERGDLTAVMGGVELDLRGAGTGGAEAVIDVFVMWGGVEIWVPPDWAVANEVTVLMGGAEDRSSGVQGARNRLVVRGFVLMGGLEIKT